MNSFTTATIKLAYKKGLRIARNSFQSGWSITLPNGSVSFARTDADMIRFVRSY